MCHILDMPPCLHDTSSSPVLIDWASLIGGSCEVHCLPYVNYVTSLLRVCYVSIISPPPPLKKWQKLTIKLLKELWGSRNQIKFASTRAKGIKRETTSRQALIAWTWLWFDLTWGMLRLFLCQNFTTLFYIVTFPYFFYSVFLFLTTLSSLWIFFGKCEKKNLWSNAFSISGS